MSIELLTAKVAELEGRLQASTRFIAWGLSHDQITHATLKRWVDEVSRVADETFKLNGCCHWEGVCDAIEKMAARLSPAASVEASKPETRRAFADVPAWAQETAYRIVTEFMWGWEENASDELTACQQQHLEQVAKLLSDCGPVESPAVHLDAPATWIEQAKESVQYLKSYLGRESGNREQAITQLGGLNHFLSQCRSTEAERLASIPAPCPECAKLAEYFKTEPDLAGLRSIQTPTTDAEFAAMILGNRKVFLDAKNKRIAQLESAYSNAENGRREFKQKLEAEERHAATTAKALSEMSRLALGASDAWQESEDDDETGRSESGLDRLVEAVKQLKLSYQSASYQAMTSVPLVAATEHRANALSAVNRVIATPGIGAAAAGILIRVREFIESTVPAEEQPQEVVYGKDAEETFREGVWVRFHGQDQSGAWVKDSSDSRTNLARGVCYVRVADIPKPPPAPKPTFELPPPGTLFKVKLRGGQQYEIYRFNSGNLAESTGVEWTEETLRDHGAELVAVSAQFNMGPVK